MRTFFHAALVNDPFGDPAVFVDCHETGEALLFDLGDVRTLSPRKLLRVGRVCVSHAHMDHFMGFDWLLRLCLGRDRAIQLFGPPGFIGKVEHKLGAYTWNLVGNYLNDLRLSVTEVDPEGRARRATFRARTGFARESEEEFAAGSVLSATATDTLTCTLLDHRTPSLAFALTERAHVNVWKDRLTALGLVPGPWLKAVKQAWLGGVPGESEFEAQGRDGRLRRVRLDTLLTAGALTRQRGQKIAYVTDVFYYEENARRIVQLARGADVLFIETVFLEADRDLARAKGHLTAHQAGLLAKAAGVRAVVPFHFSPRYRGRSDELLAELAEAFGRTNADCGGP